MGLKHSSSELDKADKEGITKEFVHELKNDCHDSKKGQELQ